MLLNKFENIVTSGNTVSKVKTAELSINLKNDEIVSYHPYRLPLSERQKVQTIAPFPTTPDGYKQVLLIVDGCYVIVLN